VLHHAQTKSSPLSTFFQKLIWLHPVIVSKTPTSTSQASKAISTHYFIQSRKQKKLGI
jgi:hypothetical protein